MAAARLRLGPALVLSALCHGGIVAAVAALNLPAPPPIPSYHSVNVTFVHPPLAKAEPVPEPARPAPVQPRQTITERKVVSKPPPKPRPVLSPQPTLAPAPLLTAVAQAEPQPVLSPTAPEVTPQVPTPVAAQPVAAIAATDASPAPLPVIRTPDYLSPPVAPAYPPAARRLQIEGTVVVRALVERPGHPSQVTLWRSSGESLLDRSALEAVRGWRFRPMTHAGGTVAAWVEVPITFSISNT